MKRSPVFIGEVVWTGWRGTRRAAQLSPFAVTSDDREAWARAYSADEMVGVFPNVGRVSWLDPPEEASYQSVWSFELAEQPTYDPSIENRDRYMVAHHSARPAVEVLDLVQLGGEPSGRERLTVEGVELPPAAQRTYVLRDDSLWSQPLAFVRVPETGRWIIDPHQCDQPLKWTPWDQKNALLTVGLDSPRHFLAPEAVPKGRVRLRDWCPDAKLLERVIGRFRKWGLASSSVAEVERAFEQCHDLLENPRQTILNLEFERERFERARCILARLKTSAEVASVVGRLLEVGPIADELAREKEQILESERARARQAAEAELATTREELRLLGEQIEAKKSDLGGLDSAIRQRKEELDRSLDQLDDEQTRRLEAIRAAPERFVAEVGVLRAALAVQPQQTSPHEGGVSSPAPRPVSPAAPVQGYDDEAQFLGEVSLRLLERDVPAELAPMMHAILLAGVVPLLYGSRASHVIEAYAGALGVAEPLWVSVAPTWLHPADAFDPQSRAIGLRASVEEAAVRCGELRMVVLDGVNRAPIESFLLPLLECASGAWNTTSGRPLPVHSGPPSGPSGGLPRWPRNLLVAGILRDGTTSLPIPADTWATSALLHCDLLGHLQVPNQFANRHPCLRGQTAGVAGRVLSVRVWDAWRATRNAIPLTPCTQFWAKSQEKCSFTRAGRDVFLRLYAALRPLETDDAVALGRAVAFSLLPQLLRQGSNAVKGLDAFEAVPLPYPDLRGASAEVGRVIG